MRCKFRAAIAAFIIAACFAGAAVAGPFEEGVAAYARGDYATAAIQYREAAEQGSAAAQHNLGLAYYGGQRVPQDYAEAAKWFRKAADQGDDYAQSCLGHMFSTGHGVPQDHAESVRWSRKSSDQGNAAAQYNLGVAYASGEGAPQDYVLAHMWFNLSAAQGDQYAAHNRDAVARRMTPAQIAEAQKLAREWKPTAGR